MDFKKSKRFLLTLAALYWALVVLIYAVAHPQFHYTAVKGDTLSAQSVVGEIGGEMQIEQRLTAPADQITGIEILVDTYGRTNRGTLQAELLNEQGETVARGGADISAFENFKYASIPMEQTAEVRQGENLTLRLSAPECTEGNAVTVYYGNTVSTGRFDIAKQISENERYKINGNMGAGMLCARLSGLRVLSFYKTYWVITTCAFAALAGYAAWGYQAAKKGKNSSVAALCTLYCKYDFLLRQLVSRDFKTKYKRSVLGMAWSFLNPLLTMAVQYIVFSTLFKSDTANYPVYLLTGIVFFNFFNEAVGMGMTSITGNASLIKKVYMPKYIYPFSRLFSSLINFVLALIPLFLVVLVTGTAIRPSMLLLVFDILCLMGFVLGMMLIMSTAMTFFQDTQFLWSVLSMLWMYMTPIFYTENIIPQNLLTLYHMNPMYQYVTFARICIIDGVSPEPMAYLWCIVSSVVVFVLGILTFKKHQDQFVLYL